ncbi:MAG TPA: YdcF family protein [Gemmatimonadales bacterium]|nr:YdcF family protein [Gemmatimonadales bacterium]
MLRLSPRRLALAAGIAALAIYVSAFVGVWLVSREDQRRPVEAIVVMGAAQYNGKPSPVLRARLDHAAALYREGLAPAVVVTGGIGEGDRVSEATVGQQYLVAHQVPVRAVVVRPVGRSTLTSIRSVAEWARQHSVKRVLLVSDPFHMLRLRLEAKRVGLEPYTSPTPTSPISANWREELGFLAAEALKIPVVLLRLP